MKNCCNDTRSDNAFDMRNPEDQIQAGNDWYVGDQFKQLAKPGLKFIIEQRWRCFGEALSDFLKNRTSKGEGEALDYLDAGCGDGINLQWAERFFQNNHIDIRITALDYNRLRIERVLEKQLVKEARVASLLEAPFKNSTFDIILCNHVLEHIENYRKALSEMFRILKPGGLLLLGVPNEGCFLAWLRNNVVQRSILKKTDHVNFFRSETLSVALSNAGFDVVRTFHEGFLLPYFWAHYVLTYFRWGARLLSVFGRLLPSQSGDIMIYAIKPLPGDLL